MIKERDKTLLKGVFLIVFFYVLVEHFNIVKAVLLTCYRAVSPLIYGILDCDFDINPKVINGSNESCKLCEYRDICYQREKDIVYINKEVKDDGEVFPL